MTAGGDVNPRREPALGNSPSGPLRAAIQRHDSAVVLQFMTQHRPTFTARDLKSALRRYSRNPAECNALLTEILTHPDAVRLSETASDPASRYTAKPILETEQSILRMAARLAQARQHSVSESVRAFDLKTPAFQSMNQEQTRAVNHATGSEGLALIDGRAGTGIMPITA